MKLSEIPEDTAPTTALAVSPAGVEKQNISKTGGETQEQPSALGALFRGFLQGFQVKGLPLTPAAEANRQKVETQINQQGDAAAAQPGIPGMAAQVGRVGGSVAATAPLMGGGAGVTLPARMALGAARGGAAAAMTPGSGAAGTGIGAAIGGAVPLAGAALAPAMPDVGQFVSSTMQKFPRLARFLQGGEERTVDGFDRSVARQVLEPIGGDVPRNLKAGHGLVDHVYDQLDRAYEDIKPSLSLNQSAGTGAWQTYEPELQRIRDELSSADWQKSFDKFITNRVTNRFDKNGVMDGQAFKDAEHDLTKRINQLYGTQNAELGDALSEAREMFRDSLMKQNPAQAPELQKINGAYSMFYRMSKAASGKSAEGKFTPSDLLGAIRQQEKNPHAFARGKAMAGGPALPDNTSVLQAYARLGEKHLKGARVGPMDIMHAFHPGSWVSMAGKAAMRGGASIGRGVKQTAPLTAPVAGRAAGTAEPKVQDRMKAARKVGELKSQVHSANRRGDLKEMQSLNSQLAEAIADYRKLRPSAA